MKSQTTTYREHTITQGGTNGFAPIFGSTWCDVRGPAANGGCTGLKLAKQMVDEGILEAECKAKTNHEPTLERDGKLRCSHCNAYRGEVPKKGEGAVWTYYRNAANGHRYGYNTKPDRLGKWYASDYSFHKVRLVKCATRAKAKAKATKWWLDAKQKAKAKAKAAA